MALYQLSYYRTAIKGEGKAINGAGDGNRTHVASLEGWNSTIELHPHNGAVDETRTRDLHLGKVALYQLSYYRISHSEWCGRRDSNSYALRHWNLNPARLPIPPRPHEA